MVLDRFAVIGNPISHSLSPVIHQRFAEQLGMHLTYEKIQGQDSAFEKQVSDFFGHGGKGLNVTLPFKQRAFSMAQITTPRAKIAGAANTLWMRDNKLSVDNTDGVGLLCDLSRYIDLQNKNILILGAGGAVRGILEPLLKAKPADLVVANRTIEKARELTAYFPMIKCSSLISLSGEFDLIINATSASLEEKFIVLPEECLFKKPLGYDLAYKQHEATAFVHYMRSMGCEAIDGLGMLVEQAAEAFYIWKGIRPSTIPVLSSLREF